MNGDHASVAKTCEQPANEARCSVATGSACPICGGNGMIDYSAGDSAASEKCETCDGTGFLGLPLEISENGVPRWCAFDSEPNDSGQERRPSDSAEEDGAFAGVPCSG